MLAVIRVFHERRHPPAQHKPSPAFTRTPAWRAFKLFYCLAVPILTIWAAYAYDATLMNPYDVVDWSAPNHQQQLKLAQEVSSAQMEQARPVGFSIFGAIPLLAIGVFYAVRQAITYIIGHPGRPGARP